jgi:hypothetical protein
VGITEGRLLPFVGQMTGKVDGFVEETRNLEDARWAPSRATSRPQLWISSRMREGFDPALSAVLSG